MVHQHRTIAVTGLNATDNPAAGVAVLRSLRDACSGDRLVGLAYDALEPGIYAHGVWDDVFMLPYPSSSPEAFLERLCQIHAQLPLSFILPTLDAELPIFIELDARLRALGISTLLPTREQFDARSKAHLPALARQYGLRTPETMLINSLDELRTAEQRMHFPIFIKGPFYGAKLVTNTEEAQAAFHLLTSEWGFPLLAQAVVPTAEREERNAVGLGDGKGGLLGAVAMKKLAVTDKGKAWAGITIRDPQLLALAARFAQATCWRGPFELEVMLASDGTYYIIEINPRFPAWVYLATSAGMNLPALAVEVAMDLSHAPKVEPDYAIGKMFVRISLDQIATVADLERVVVRGERHRES